MQTDADAAIRCVTTHSPVAMAVLTRCVLTARRPRLAVVNDSRDWGGALARREESRALARARAGTGAGVVWAALEPIREVWIHDEAVAASRLSMMRIIARRMDDDVQQEAQRVDQDVPLATFDLLARVVARRIEPSPPFRAPFAVCESMIAA